MNPMEKWLKIPGFSGKYMISSTGLVKSFKYKKEAILKPRPNDTGYLRIVLYKDGMSFVMPIHRLVAEAFIPNPDNKPFINHINGLKDDNRSENLEWCTHSENMRHAHANGLINLNGENNPNSKLKKRDVVRIRKLYIKGGVTQKELANDFDTTQSRISRIVNNKNWVQI